MQILCWLSSVALSERKREVRIIAFAVHTATIARRWTCCNPIVLRIDDHRVGRSPSAVLGDGTSTTLPWSVGTTARNLSDDHREKNDPSLEIFHRQILVDC